MHPASHPELLDELAADFRSHHYDIRRTLRAIALSDAYQLDSRKPDGVSTIHQHSLGRWNVRLPLNSSRDRCSWRCEAKLNRPSRAKS